MKEGETRWSLPDLESALLWAKNRNEQGITCILSPHGEYSTTVEASQKALDELLCCVRRIYEGGIKSSVAVKLTTLGAMFDERLCRDLLVVLFEDSVENMVDVEMDMESKHFVDFTLEVVDSCLADFPLTMTLQAYLDRTRSDIQKALEQGTEIRLVKGAYSGDISEFREVQERYMQLAEVLLLSLQRFRVATHDPDIISWIMDATQDFKLKVEFSFLKGLAEKTKLELVEQGWPVSEYVPYGPGGEAYEDRRNSYLRMLDKLGRSPAP